MKDNLKLKKEDRAEKELEFEALVKKAETSALSDAEVKQLSTLKEEIETLDEEIEELQGIEETAKKIAKKKISVERPARGAEQDHASEVKELNKMGGRYSFGKAFQDVQQRRNIDGVEKEMYELAAEEAAEAGVSLTGNVAIPSKFIQIGKTTKLLDITTEGTDVRETELRGLIPILQPDPVVTQMGIQVLSGLRGNVQFPRHSGDVAFAWEGESDNNAETTPTYDNISISPNRVGGYVDVTVQMLKQSSFVIESHLRQRLKRRYELTVDDAVLDGAGSGNEPTGIFNYSGVNTLSLGSGGAGNDMTYAALLSMIRDTKTGNARSGKSGFITNASGEHALALTPLQGSGVEGNFIYKYGSGNLVGHKFVTTETVRSNYSEGSQSDLVGIVFSSYWPSAILGTWGGLDILFDPYTQAIGGKVRFVANAYMDVEFEHAAEFSICTDWDATDLPALT